MNALAWIRDRLGVNGENWPPQDLVEVWEEIELYAALRSSDDAVIRQIEGVHFTERYLLSPVPRMISRASANLLYGEPAEIHAPSDVDQARLDFIVSENELDNEIHRAAMISSSEGEVWGRILVRPDLLDAPIIEYVSRRRVIPHFASRFVQGATFVSEWPTGSVEVVRLFETYAPGAIFSQLYRGTRTSLGQPMGLDQFDATKGTPPVVYTGIDAPLVAFIPNSIDDDPERGYSDYKGLEERFYSINRAVSAGDSNTELTGKQRALVDSQYIGPGGKLSGEEIFIRDAEQGDIDEHTPLEVLSFDYNAGEIVNWLDHLIDSTLSFGGASPQLVGRALDGAAVSGTALRLKMVHSLLEASGKGRYSDRGHQRLLRFSQIIDSRPTVEIGYGRRWSKPDALPALERQDGLPRDDIEAATYLSTLVGASSISIEERVAYLHPDWDDERRDEEVALLKESSSAPPVPGSLPM